MARKKLTEPIQFHSCRMTKSRMHTPISTVVHAEVVCARNSSRSAFFSAILYDVRSLHPGTCLNTKTPSAKNERFLPAFPSPLLSGDTLDKQTGHGRGRDLVTISIFSLPRVVRSINVQCLPHPLRHHALFYGPDQPIRQRGETKTRPICSRAE